MQPEEPSRTAFAAALHRAGHQLLDGGRIFADPLALTILGADAESRVREQAVRPTSRGMRFFIAARAAFAESCLADAVEQRGVRQLIVLGAGLDTFAYRNPFGDRLRVFEVDHPSTQLWKRERLGEAGIAIPANLTFAPIDFERDDLVARLRAAGFDSSARSFFIWLGVTFYLTGESIRTTLAAIGSLAGGAEVTFDYSDPPDAMSELGQAFHQQLAERVAKAGEPFLSHFEPVELHAMLGSLGFIRIEDLDPQALMVRYLDPGVVEALRAAAPSALRQRGGHVIFAATD